MREDAEKNPVIARDRLMLGIGFYTGLRISDILSLTWLQLTEDRLEVKEKKTGDIRLIEVNAALRKIFEQTLKVLVVVDFNDLIFTGTRGPRSQKPMSVVAANGRI